jgi:hypothetical protein
MAYTVEQTQDHLSLLGIKCPPLGGDKRHADSAKYPFLDYDILLTEDEDITSEFFWLPLAYVI